MQARQLTGAMRRGGGKSVQTGHLDVQQGYVGSTSAGPAAPPGHRIATCADHREVGLESRAVRQTPRGSAPGRPRSRIRLRSPSASTVAALAGGGARDRKCEGRSRSGLPCSARAVTGRAHGEAAARTVAPDVEDAAGFPDPLAESGSDPIPRCPVVARSISAPAPSSWICDPVDAKGDRCTDVGAGSGEPRSSPPRGPRNRTIPWRSKDPPRRQRLGTRGGDPRSPENHGSNGDLGARPKLPGSRKRLP